MTTHKFETVNIKGKEYVPVHERIAFFRSEPAYADWSIITNFIELGADQCFCRATINDGDGNVRSTGHAHEEKSAGYINATSFVENCETSAVGRALAMLGIGIDTSIASANEVVDAVAKQAQQGAPLDSSQVESAKVILAAAAKKGREAMLAEWGLLADAVRKELAKHEHREWFDKVKAESEAVKA